MKILDLTMGYPRSGRERLGRFVWLGRAADKARAKLAGKAGDYISLCPIDKGFLARTGIMEETFVELIRGGSTDEQLAEYFERNVAPHQRETANEWVLTDMTAHLDQLDREEGRAAA